VTADDFLWQDCVQGSWPDFLQPSTIQGIRHAYSYSGFSSACCLVFGGAAEDGARPAAVRRQSNMSGVTPYRTLHDIARALPELTGRDEIESALDELEYLFEVMPPEMQEYAEPVIEALRQKLAQASAKPA
jgi:hypothetical protein